MAFDSTVIDLPFNDLDDRSFHAALYEMSCGSINFDFDHLETLVFNPIEHLATVQSVPINSSLDLDLNFYTYSQSNNYMIEDEINGLTSDKLFDQSFPYCTLTAVVWLAISITSKRY